MLIFPDLSVFHTFLLLLASLKLPYLHVPPYLCRKLKRSKFETLIFLPKPARIFIPPSIKAPPVPQAWTLGSPLTFPLTLHIQSVNNSCWFNFPNILRSDHFHHLHCALPLTPSKSPSISPGLLHCLALAPCRSWTPNIEVSHILL